LLDPVLRFLCAAHAQLMIQHQQRQHFRWHAPRRRWARPNSGGEHVLEQGTEEIGIWLVQ
jgi:hypothetical protein